MKKRFLQELAARFIAPLIKSTNIESTSVISFDLLVHYEKIFALLLKNCPTIIDKQILDSSE